MLDITISVVLLTVSIELDKVITDVVVVVEHMFVAVKGLEKPKLYIYITIINFGQRKTKAKTKQNTLINTPIWATPIATRLTWTTTTRICAFY